MSSLHDPAMRHNFPRLFRHLLGSHRQANRQFPKPALKSIEKAIGQCEKRHAGEIRFVIEAGLNASMVWAGCSPRQRAIELFSHMHVWDTQHNNGVLIYVLLADRAVEIVADRGVAGGHVDITEWQPVCRLMEDHFRAGRFEQGAVAGVEAVADVLARHAPGQRGSHNELPDAPVLLS